MAHRDSGEELASIALEFVVLVLTICLVLCRWLVTVVGRTFAKYWGTTALLIWLCGVGCCLVVNLALYLLPALRPAAWAVTCLFGCLAVISLAGLEWVLDRLDRQPAPDQPLALHFDPADASLSETQPPD